MQSSARGTYLFRASISILAVLFPVTFFFPSLFHFLGLPQTYPTVVLIGALSLEDFIGTECCTYVYFQEETYVVVVLMLYLNRVPYHSCNCVL